MGHHRNPSVLVAQLGMVASPARFSAWERTDCSLSPPAPPRLRPYSSSANPIVAGCSLWYTLRKTTRCGSSVRERPTGASGKDMKKAHRNGDEMRGHYDFSGGVRGKYAKRYAEGTNVIVLDPDVAEVFKDRESVNETLRAVARIIHIQSRKLPRTSPTRPSGRLRPRNGSGEPTGGRRGHGS
jgi:hypothetical protein